MLLFWANDVHCNFPPEALMNTVSSFEAALLAGTNFLQFSDM